MVLVGIRAATSEVVGLGWVLRVWDCLWLDSLRQMPAETPFDFSQDKPALLGPCAAFGFLIVVVVDSSDAGGDALRLCSG